MITTIRQSLLAAGALLARASLGPNLLAQSRVQRLSRFASPALRIRVPPRIAAFPSLDQVSCVSAMSGMVGSTLA